MLDFIAQYHNPNEERINFDLMYKRFDKPQQEHYLDSFKTLEDFEFIKILDYYYTDDEKEIDINKYIVSRKKNKKINGKKAEDYRYVYIEDSRYAELTVRFLLTHNGEEKVITKSILLPLEVEDSVYYLKGKKYFVQYQMVDASTYSKSSSVTLKTLGRVTVTRDRACITDTNGNEYKAPLYLIKLYSKDINLLLVHFASKGFLQTLAFFRVESIIRLVTKEDDIENSIHFKIKKDLYIRVEKYFFNKYKYVQSIVAMILKCTSNRFTKEKFLDRNYWLSALGKIASTANTDPEKYIPKAKSVIAYYERMLDETTKENLLVSDVFKQDIYGIRKWLFQNFNELRAKDNMKLENKRLRCGEYLASFLTIFLQMKAGRIAKKHKNSLQMKDIEDIFAFNGDILIKLIYKSKLLRYDDTVNDCTMFNKFRYTIKGPQSLGNKSSKTISSKDRNVDPSRIGFIDQNVCGNSDPGTSGMLTPFCRTNGLRFSDKHEPEDFEYEFVKDLLAYNERKGKDAIKIRLGTKDEYYNAINR